MPIYKYVSSTSGLRYLESWRLRLSPATALNDPFEFELVLSESYEAAFNARSEALYAQLDKEAGRTSEERLAQWKLANAARNIKRVSLTEAVREAYKVSLGVLCLTRTQRHLLMWSHYADGHRGMLFEFDDKHACFSRSIPNTMFQGKLIPVTYSDTRTTVKDESADAVASSLTTKALEWAYEQEVRMFLPLSEVGHTASVDANGSLHLIDVHAEALKTITLGCLSTDQASVLGLLRGVAEHVTVMTSRIDGDEYRLHYEPLA
jgi:Protein of unknown function (DUF2971)